MAIKRTISILGLSLLFLSCGQNRHKGTTVTSDEVIFDVAFKSARLSNVKRVEKNTYTAIVLPESEPVNKSPWYAFAVQAKDHKKIKLTLDYGEYQHRYIPKISQDRLNWQTLDASKIEIDTTNHTATLNLDVFAKKLYVAAQEIETSDDTNEWIKKLKVERPGINRSMAGKTALGNDNYVLSYKKATSDNFIVLVARQHPPEIPGGTIGFKSFYETLLSDTETAIAFREKFNIYAFPLLNPDGADLGNWRHNGNGKDLNRDWTEFSQPETKMVKDFVETKVKEGGKIRFALDFHTSHSGPYLLVLDSINELKTPKIIPNWIAQIESKDSLKVEARRRSQELPYCYNYFFKAFGVEAVTYEDGDEVDRKIIRTKAKIYAAELMKVLLKKAQENDWDK